MFRVLGGFISRHWLVVIAGWIVVAIALHLAAPRWDDVTNDGDLAYMPDRMTSVRGDELLKKAFPSIKSKSQIVLVAARDSGLTPPDFEFLERLAAPFAVDGHQGLPISDVWTPSTDIVGRKLISPDRQCALALLMLTTEFMAVQNLDILQKVERILADARKSPDLPAGLQLAVSGSAAIGGDTMASAAESIRHTELMTISLVLVILALVYRAPVLVLVPLLTLAMSVLVATDLVALLTQVRKLPGMEWFDFKIFKTTKIFVITILFGSGTDFCLFLISRYREELEHGLTRRQALAASLAQVGHAITASAMTTIFGLSMMFFADFGKFRNSGPAIALCLFVALLACLSLAPAMLRLFGRIVFWPFGVGPKLPNEAETGPFEDERARHTLHGRFWYAVGQAIISRPGTILVASVLLLAPLAYEGLGIKISYNLLSDLDPHRPSIVGTRLLQQHFPPGDLGPITVMVYQPNGHFDQEQGEQQLARLTKTIYDMPGVSSVRSIAEPLGDTPGLFNPLSPAGRRKLAALRNPRVKNTFLSPVPQFAGEVAKLDVVLKYDPFSHQASQTLDTLDQKLTLESHDRDSPWHGAQFDFTGVTAGTRDLKSVTQSDERLIERLVTIAVLGILIVLLRRPVICLYLIASVLFSYYVTIGTTQLLFSHLYADFDGLDWKVPIFLFVILIAVGEDYNIYLATRIFEEQHRWGLLEGLRRAVVRTGGIITSCGVIMAGTFVSIMTGTLRAMLELGFALTLGVLLDTLVVRPILVPAFLSLWFRWQENRALAREPHPTAEASRNGSRSGLHEHADRATSR